MSETHSGLLNWETQCVYTWLTKEEGRAKYWAASAFEAAQEARENPSGPGAAAYLAREMSYQLRLEIDVVVTGLWRELLTRSLNRVDWEAIATSFVQR